MYSLLKKEFFKKEFDINNKEHKGILTLTALIFIIILLLMQQTIARNAPLTKSIHINQLYGVEFVESIINGNINVNKYDPENLDIIRNSQNPYDYNAPEREHKSIIYFDSAYFNGNAYMYYGILPALILLVPIRLITGDFMYMEFATFVFLAISAIFTVKLFSEIIYRYYKKIPLSLVVLLCTFALFNNKILWTMSRPWTYEFVISAGYCFVMAGMYYFFKYLRLKRTSYLFASCLLMALSVACRPTCLLASIFIFAKLVYDFIKDIKDKKVDSKYISKLVICMLPYLIIGGLLMIYNYIRFGNIVEFGSNYQMSVTDFRNFGFNINRAIIGTITFLFSPIKFNWDFPFVTSTSFMPEYMGYYYSQPVGGGYFTVTIIGIVILLLPWLWKKAKEYNKEMNALIILSVAVAIVLSIFEASKAGSVGRYTMDFLWMLNIATVLLILLLYNYLKSECAKLTFIKILLLLIMISCIMNTLLVYSNENALLERRFNLKTFYYIKYLIAFWI